MERVTIHKKFKYYRDSEIAKNYLDSKSDSREIRKYDLKGKDFIDPIQVHTNQAIKMGAAAHLECYSEPNENGDIWFYADLVFNNEKEALLFKLTCSRIEVNLGD